MEEEIIEFINRRFPHKDKWLDGNCYYFALILKEKFGGIICYDVIDGHFVLRIYDSFDKPYYHYYDYNGIVNTQGKHHYVEWDTFYEYDLKQMLRIQRDCIE